MVTWMLCRFVQAYDGHIEIIKMNKNICVTKKNKKNNCVAIVTMILLTNLMKN